MTNAVRKTTDVFDEDRTAQVAALSNKVFGHSPKRVAFPGGKSRSAFIADMGDAPYVFAKRSNRGDAQLEGIVLRTLGPSGYVPRLKAVVDQWVVQEWVPGERLPVVLNQTADMESRKLRVSEALECLIHIHNEAQSANLHHRIPKIGSVDKWLWNRTGAAKRISKSVGLRAPELDRDKLVRLMDVKRDEFVKWDARPGNAMVGDQGTIWFDWEDCGHSKALDDLAYLLCDEWTNLDEQSEAELLKSYFPFFNRSLSQERGQHYLRLFGVTHMILRIRMAQNFHTRDGEWWDRDYCLNGDKVGVTPFEMNREINRASRWADGVSELKPLVPWLQSLQDHYQLDR